LEFKDNKQYIKKPSLKNININDIDEEIDIILLKNKWKTKKYNKKELDLEKISLKNKKGNTIYYLRKKSKNILDNFSSNNSIDKNNSEPKKNHHEKQDEIVEKNNRKRLNNLKITNEVVKSKDYDKVVSEIEKELDKIQLEMTGDAKKTILKNLIENTRFDDSVETKDVEKKISKSNKKSHLFSINKTLKNDTKKDINWVSPPSYNLGDIKKLETHKIIPVKNPEKKEKIVKEWNIGKSKVKKLLFKQTKVTEVKPSSLKQTTPDQEKKDNTKQIEKVETKLLDKKIIELQKNGKLDKDSLEDEPETSSIKPLEESIKTKPKVTSVSKEPYKKPDPNLYFDISPDVKESERDHPFFNGKDSHEKKHIDKKISKSNKKSRFLLKNRLLINKTKKDFEEVLLPIDSSAEIIKYETQKIIPFKISDKKQKFIKKRNLGKSKIKKLFFKRNKVSEINSISLEQKIPDLEKINIKPTFTVEKITFGDEPEKEEAKLVDKKIIESEVKEKSDEKLIKIKPEFQANKLVEEHLKNKSVITSVEEESDKKSDSNLYFDTSPNVKESDHEHVFFNEEDSPQYGWSPQIIEKGKNKEPEKTISRDEIGLDELGKVVNIEIPKVILSTASVKLAEFGFSENEWEEIDFYALEEPFVYVEILRQKDTLDKCYFLVEMNLSEEEENLLAFIKDTLASLSIDAEEMEKKGEDEYLIDILEQIIREYNITINNESKKKIFYFISKSCLGLGKINPLMKDPNIEDISCDGCGVPVFLYHRKYGSLKSNIKFKDEDELSSFIFKLAQKCGKHISIAEPMLDATMPDGSRIQMTLSDEITAKGSTFTIRKFRSDPFSPTDLIEFNTMSSEMIAYMWIAVENGINTLFAGGTASGKTTTLNAIMLFIPRESKIVSIEETREINLPHPNWIPGVSRSGFGEVVADRVVGEIDTYDLMKAALRQRPEYIIVGEIRGKEAYVLFQAMATGHATYSTAHADSAQSLIHRLEGKPINIPRIMLQSLDLVCIHVITRVKNMRARRCKQIIEIIDIDPTTKEILTNEVFHWDPVEDKFIYSGKSYILERIRSEKDLTKEYMNQEISNRKKIVEWMNINNIRGFKDVANIVSKYAESPEELLEKLIKDDN